VRAAARGALRRAGRLVLAVLLASGSAAGDASAARIDLAASDLGGGSVVETDLGPGALAFDPAFPGFAPMRLVIELEDGDFGAPIAWNALVDNLSGELWAAFSIRLEGAQWGVVGSALANAGAVSGVDAGVQVATVRFAAPGEPAGLDLGAPFGVGTDWRIDVGALGVTSFVMVLTPVAVPEPGTALLVGLGLAGLVSRRRRGRRAAP
jgi:hypothetical protein